MLNQPEDVSVSLTSNQVAEIVCSELARLIKTEIDRKKEGAYCDEELVTTSLKMIKHYLSPSEYSMLLDVVNEYNTAAK